MGWKDTIAPIKDAEPAKAKSWRDTISEIDEGPSKSESAYKGAIQGASAGFGDELAGGIDALGSVVGLHGLGSSPINEIRRETEEERAKSLGDTYRSGRDSVRGVNKAAQEANPGSYLAGNVGGGVVGAGKLSGGGALGAVAGGAAYGLGDSDADLTKGEIGGAAIDSALGAAGGAVGHGIGKAIGAVATKSGREGLKTGVAALRRGGEQGAKTAAEEAIPLPGIKAAQTGWGAIKGALGELKDQSKVTSEFKELADKARSVLGSSESGAIGNVSDDQAVIAALMSDGDNPVKQAIAQKSASLNPGAGSAEDYHKLLNMSSADRQAARAFNPREAAKELVPDVEEAQNLFKQARGDRYGQLQNAARESFDSSSIPPVLDELEGAAKDAGALSGVPSKVKSAINDATAMIMEGKGFRSHGLTEGALENAHPEEQFNRLQKARELIDSNLDWATQNKDTESSKLLKGVRDSIDTALKTSPEKVEGDSLYKASKGVEDKFFGATEFRKNGNVDIDEGKISRLLGGTDQAKRFQSALAEAKSYAANEGLDPAFRQKMADLVTRIEGKVGVADNQRALSSFRYKQGPSSPAIERLQSANGKNSLLKDAVNAPAGFLNSVDEFGKIIEQRLGKPYNDLSADQKAKVARFWGWQKSNAGASLAQSDNMWNRLVMGK